MSSVASSYIQLRKYDRQLVIAEKTLASRKKVLELAQIRYDNGYTSELEVKQAGITVSDALAEIARLKILNAQEENLLSVLVGRNPGPIVRGRQIDELNMPFSVPVGLPSSLLGQRPDILAAEQRLIASDALIGAARAAFFPEISLTGMYGVISPHLSKLFTGDATTWNYGGSFFQTIFDGGRLIAQLDAAEAVKWQAFYEYERVIQNAFKEVNDALIAHQQSQDLLKIEKERLKISREYLELATLQYTNGQVDYLNILDAERNLFDSQLEVVQAESDTFLSLIDVYTALGGGWVIKPQESECDSKGRECDLEGFFCQDWNDGQDEK
jgi:multidrug efflux system outer membrane protein